MGVTGGTRTSASVATTHFDRGSRSLVRPAPAGRCREPLPGGRRQAAGGCLPRGETGRGTESDVDGNPYRLTFPPEGKPAF